MSENFTASVSTGNNAHTKIVHLKGELDKVNIEELKKEVDPQSDDANVFQLIFDLSELNFINSKGIGYLVSVYSHLTKNGKTMIITNASQPVMDVISLVGLTSIIPYRASMEQAEDK